MLNCPHCKSDDITEDVVEVGYICKSYQDAYTEEVSFCNPKGIIEQIPAKMVHIRGKKVIPVAFQDEYVAECLKCGCQFVTNNEVKAGSDLEG